MVVSEKQPIYVYPVAVEVIEEVVDVTKVDCEDVVVAVFVDGPVAEDVEEVFDEEEVDDEVVEEDKEVEDDVDEEVEDEDDLDEEVEDDADEDVEDEEKEDDFDEEVKDELVELDEVINVEDESVEDEDVDGELEVEHDTVHADAVPTNITSCQPPLDQKVIIVAEDPVSVGVKVREIKTLCAAAIVAPLTGNPVAVKPLPRITGLPEVETF